MMIRENSYRSVVWIVLVLSVFFLSQSEALAEEKVLVETLTINSRNQSPVYVTAPIEPGSRYVIEASGTWYFGAGSGPCADPAYASDDGWLTVSTSLGIHPTTISPWTGTTTPGVTSLLADFGDGMQVVDWGSFRTDHSYTYELVASSNTMGFVISDWWSTWYGSVCRNNTCMGDNSGTLTVAVYKKPDVIPATVTFHPRTLNLKSEGNLITAYIQLPPDFNPGDIDTATVLLNNAVYAALTGIGDFNGDGVPELMAKFSRSAVQALLEPGDNRDITVSGTLVTGRPFKGQDAIRVI